MFSTLEKIKELAKSRGISLAKLEESLGYSTNYFYTLKQKPQTLTAYKRSQTTSMCPPTTYWDELIIHGLHRSASIIDTDPIEEQTLVMFRKETEDMSTTKKSASTKHSLE